MAFNVTRKNYFSAPPYAHRYTTRTYTHMHAVPAVLALSGTQTELMILSSHITHNRLACITSPSLPSSIFLAMSVRVACAGNVRLQNAYSARVVPPSCDLFQYA